MHQMSVLFGAPAGRDGASLAPPPSSSPGLRRAGRREEEAPAGGNRNQERRRRRPPPPPSPSYQGAPPPPPPYRDDPPDAVGGGVGEIPDEDAGDSDWVRAHRPESPSSYFLPSVASASASSSRWRRPDKGTLKDFLFGFLYEEDGLDDEDDLENELYRSATAEPPVSSLLLRCGGVQGPLFASIFLFAAANAVPVAVAPHLRSEAEAFGAAGDGGASSAPSATTQLAAAAVLGMSVGKLASGPLVDLFGARRISSLYSLGLSLALLVLACTPSLASSSARRLALPRICYGVVEFCSAVQWPSALVVLASHHRGDSRGAYEGGVYAVSLAGRAGALAAIVAGAKAPGGGAGSPSPPSLLGSWRVAALGGSWLALLSVAVTFLYVQDAPGVPDQPQNPVDPNLVRKWFPDYYYTYYSHISPNDEVNDVGGMADLRRSLPPRQQPPLSQSLGRAARLGAIVARANVAPSLRHILLSPVFWLVAAAHAGCAMVRTSDRVLASYLADTRSSSASDAAAGAAGGASSPSSSGMAPAFLGAGTVLGLAFAGSAFATRNDRERKGLVAKLYLLTIASCYALSLLAVPAVGRILREPADGSGGSDPGGLLAVLQGIAIGAAGFGISVPLYHIPSLVGAGFGCDKGLFLSYLDGVAYGLASLVWRVVGDAVQHSNNGTGWAYGWAAVALLVIPCAVLMVEFMEHYFCRHRNGGTLETILIA